MDAKTGAVYRVVWTNPDTHLSGIVKEHLTRSEARSVLCDQVGRFPADRWRVEREDASA